MKSYNSSNSWKDNSREKGKNGYRPGKFGRGEFPRSGNPAEKGKRGGVTLYDAVCARCGKDTLVPFMPNGSKPVYCRECMEENRPQGSTGRFEERRDDRRERRDTRRDDRQSFDRPRPQSTFHQHESHASTELMEKITSLESTIAKLSEMIDSTFSKLTVANSEISESKSKASTSSKNKSSEEAPKATKKTSSSKVVKEKAVKKAAPKKTTVRKTKTK